MQCVSELDPEPLAKEDDNLSSDEEIVDVLFQIPQLSDMPRGDADFQGKEIELIGLVGSTFPPELELIDPAKAQTDPDASYCEKIAKQASAIDKNARQKGIYMRIGDQLFEGVWTDERVIQNSYRRLQTPGVQQTMGTPVMVSLPPKEASSASDEDYVKATPLDADNVHTAEFRRLFVTGQKIEIYRPQAQQQQEQDV